MGMLPVFLCSLTTVFWTPESVSQSPPVNLGDSDMSKLAGKVFWKRGLTSFFFYQSKNSIQVGVD